MKLLSATFEGTGRKAQCSPNPDYPNGIAIDLSQGAEKACETDLGYPAPCIGTWKVECGLCGYTAIITAAGRVDDPVSVKVPCKAMGTA